MAESAEFATAMNLVAAELLRVHTELAANNTRMGAIETQVAGQRAELVGMNRRLDIANGRTSKNEERIDGLSAGLGRVEVALEVQDAVEETAAAVKAEYRRRIVGALAMMRTPAKYALFALATGVSVQVASVARGLLGW